MLKILQIRNVKKLTPKIVGVYFLFGAFIFVLTCLHIYQVREGKILVATAHADGTVFERTVIYLTHHNWRGAQGVIVNKPLEEEQMSIFDPEGPPQDLPEYGLMYGGPVAFDNVGRVLLPDAFSANGIKFSDLSPFEFFSDMHEILPSSQRFLYYGYAGWMPFQLNLEILRGDWEVISYDPVLVFETPSPEIWKKAAQRAAP